MFTQTITKPVQISPEKILQTGLAFWSSKVLLTAVNMQLFTVLAEKSRTAEEVRDLLGLHDRALYDFLDTLVAMNFLHREGVGRKAKYCNTIETDIFLDKKKTTYVGGLLELSNNRLFSAWGNLEESLKTGLPQNESKNAADSLFDIMYSDEQRLEEFISAMAGAQANNFAAFARKFDFSDYYTLCDIGGASAHLSLAVAKQVTDIQCTSFDLAPVAPIAQRNIDRHKESNRVKVASGNFFTDEFPKADIITMGNILHDWNLKEKKMLIKKAYRALPAGGALVVIENVIDDDRKENVFGLLMSLNMLVETRGGFDFSTADFRGWADEAGFTSVHRMHLSGPSSALIAYK